MEKVLKTTHHRTPMPFTTLTLRYEWSANVMDTTWVSDDENYYITKNDLNTEVNLYLIRN